MEHNKEFDTLAKLERMIDQDDCEFDAEDIAILRRLIGVVRGFDALGSFAGFVKRTLGWIAAIIAAFVAIKTGLFGLFTTKG